MLPIIYSGPGCPSCNNLKMWMQSNNIPYDEKCIEDAIAKGYRSIPVVEYRGEVIHGFTEQTKKRLAEIFPE